VNEVNTFPGFTAASQFPQIWQKAGLGFVDLIDILIDGALADEDRGRCGGLPRQAWAVDLV
jgi:D-alanine-D-alanine ligase